MKLKRYNETLKAERHQRESMAYQFERHYTRDEARALLPEIRQWLQRLAQLRKDLERREEQLAGLMTPGRDLGGSLVNAWVRLIPEMNELLLEFHQREIQIKDLDRGLIDFPTLISGKEVFLCCG